MREVPARRPSPERANVAFALSEKARELIATGSEIYYGNLPKGTKHDH